jgi:hypothetical protein
MKVKNKIIPLFLSILFFSTACVYIVLPEDVELSGGVGPDTGPKAWSAVVTGVTESEEGDLHVDLAIQNEMGDWSKMHAVEGKPAMLASSDGKTTPCSVVFVGTGGHRLAPGFQMRGYTAQENGELVTQPLFVECKGATFSPGSKLTINYVAFSGILDDYDPEANKSQGTLELSLDEVESDLSYPVAVPIDGLIQEAGISITGLSDNVVTLLDAQRTDAGLLFTWENFNPTKFPLKTHIGIPPVIGSDGVIYGLYETLDMAPVPLTPANSRAEWTTEVAVPRDVKDLYILLSVESNKPRTYKNYALDITDK